MTIPTEITQDLKNGLTLEEIGEKNDIIMRISCRLSVMEEKNVGIG